MPNNLLTALTAPSSALVATLFLLIPFLAAFYVIKSFEGSFARRFAWVSYSVLIIVIVLYNV
jgi:hypothetical protein